MAKSINGSVLATALAAPAFLGYCYWQNNSIAVTRYEYDCRNGMLGGLKILHLSDLHNKDFGGKITTIAKEEKPDITVMTGDMISYDSKDVSKTLSLIKKLCELSPVYYVTGNHEFSANHCRTRLFYDFIGALREYGVIRLKNQASIFEYNGQFINIIGIDGPVFRRDDDFMISRRIGRLTREDMPNLLLAHHPEKFPVFCDCSVDLALCGHTHGGQVRFPLVGGIIAPDQGFFPEYLAGAYQERKTTMIISRGLGNGSFPIRIMNRPEIVTITFKI